MALTKVDLDKAVKDGLISAQTAKDLQKKYKTEAGLSKLMQFLRDVGYVLVAGGLLTLIYTLGQDEVSLIYSVALLGYGLVAVLLFEIWRKRPQAAAMAAAVGLIIPVTLVLLLKPWLAPQNYDMPVTWHIVTLLSLIAAGYVAYRHKHWLTHLSLACFWALFALSSVGDFSVWQHTSHSPMLGVVALLTTGAAFAWRYGVKDSETTSTLWLHRLAALLIFFAILPSIYENIWAVFAALALMLVGIVLQRGAYALLGGLALLMTLIERLTTVIEGPFAAATLVIMLGVVLLSASYRGWAEKIRFKRLPAWVARN